ncbi:thiol-disulfide oxidoreductase DCC family protein [Aquisalibacillus elongatus]|uniref:Putative DCC family thiol-disulfide oxidoreductase YuxK n=1 Tax=Aquisalibacillus elongatus TaxID=485577 RepID=A0A3N5BRB3_9BACI|nr:thiol-disulfide oxidoreductase DCC family protein [Aquisalibacillus elongatus]RPF52258.1 putative DCC family thiol-disulfide oxidoreductase YuxK [Aquisalibacillus elongatus]
MKKTVLFDGECNLCNGIVQFILKRDYNKQFQFASLQGNVGQSLIEKHELPGDLSTFILLKNDKVLTKSTAALHVFKDLKGLWKFLFTFIIIPKFLRDPVYNVIANNRYKWFGKQDHCMMPKPEYKERFLD